MLFRSRRIIFGALEKATLKKMDDLVPRELVLLVPLAALVVYYGVQPQSILDACAASVNELIRNWDAALAATKSVAATAAPAH